MILLFLGTGQKMHVTLVSWCCIVKSQTETIFKIVVVNKYWEATINDQEDMYKSHYKETAMDYLSYSNLYFD